MGRYSYVFQISKQKEKNTVFLVDAVFFFGAPYALSCDGL